MNSNREIDRSMAGKIDQEFWKKKLDSGQEISHLIIKPELVYEFISGRLEYRDFRDRLEAFTEFQKLCLSEMYWIRLSQNEVNIIYEREITKGFVRKDVIDSLLSNHTGHIFVFGDNVAIKMLSFKGRVNCLGRNRCYSETGPNEYDLQVTKIKHIGCDSTERVWGRGCGYRQELVDMGVLKPDLKYKNDTPFNGLHSSNAGDKYVAKIIEEGVLGQNWFVRSKKLEQIQSVDLPQRYWEAR